MPGTPQRWNSRYVYRIFGARQPRLIILDTANFNLGAHSFTERYGVAAGASAAITDANGDVYTLSSDNRMLVNGAEVSGGEGTSELDYSNGTLYAQDQASGAWYTYSGGIAGTFTASSAPGNLGSSSSTPPTSTSVPTASPNDTGVTTGATAAITDASGNTWTITSDGQAAVNGTADTTTANVVELAYVDGEMWQENTANLWWSKANPAASWSPANGTPSSPLNGTIEQTTTSITISTSQASVYFPANSKMLFVSGTGNTIAVTGGAQTIDDVGATNTYVLPASGHGSDNFVSNILVQGDVLDLHSALAATAWNGSASTLDSYLSIQSVNGAATLSIAPTAGSGATTIATIANAGGTALFDLMTHAIT